MATTIRNEQAYQAIATRCIGPTNTRGKRIVVSAQAGRKIFDWDYELSEYANHAAAAQKFAEAWGWTGEWVGGATADGYAFCKIC